MFPLAFVARWLQGHWWGFISRNYVVWPTFFLMNVFIALKGSHFWFYILHHKKISVVELLWGYGTLDLSYNLSYQFNGRGSQCSSCYPPNLRWAIFFAGKTHLTASCYDVSSTRWRVGMDGSIRLFLHQRHNRWNTLLVWNHVHQFVGSVRPRERWNCVGWRVTCWYYEYCR